MDEDLSSARLRNCDLHGALLDHANLQGADLNSADMTAVSLKAADFSSTFISQVNFRKADLQGANFKNAVLEAVNFNGANLSKADFTGATLRDTLLIGVTLCDTKLPDGTVAVCHADDTLKLEGYSQTTSIKSPSHIVKVAVPNNIFAGLHKTHPVGVVLEALDWILKENGEIPSYVSIPAEEAMHEMQEGTLNIATVIAPSKKANDTAWLSDPIITEYSLVMVPKDKKFAISRISDLCNKRIGARAGYQYSSLESDIKTEQRDDEKNSSHSFQDSNSNITLTRYRSDGEMVRALMFGKLDAVLIGAIADLSAFRTEDVLAHFEILKVAVGTVPLSIAFAKSRYSKKDVDSFNASLARLKLKLEWQQLLDSNGLLGLIREWPLILN